MPGPLSDIPVIGPVYDLAGHLLGTFNAQGKFIKAAGSLESKIASTAASDVVGQFHVNTLFVRVVEVLLGIMLVGVGIAKLTGTDNTIAKVAGTAGKLAFV